MRFPRREFHAFIHKNEFSQLLYEFLDCNQDQVFHRGDEDLLTIMYEAYRISGGIMRKMASECNMDDYIKYVRAEHEGMANIILATVWAILSLRNSEVKSLHSVVSTLRDALQADKSFRLMNRFVSSIKSLGRHVEIQFPDDMLVVDGESASAEEAMGQAHQVAKSAQAKLDSPIQQTLIFPNVEQFNNNPGKVINQITKK